MNTPLRIGIIGCGFMGRIHSNAYKKVSNFFSLEKKPVLKAVCSIDAEQARQFASNWGFESVENDWKTLVKRNDIDVIDICVPNNLHCEIAIAAAKEGKWVFCEKPMAMNAEEGRKMTDIIEDAGVPNMVCHNYRGTPAITLAKRLIDEGRLGKIYHYRANYLQDWTMSAELPQGGDCLWRLDRNISGSGVVGDLLSHSIDLALWLNSGISEVVSHTETFIKKRFHQEKQRVETVMIDDACMFLARFKNGSTGVFESTRYAGGRKNFNTFEINGEHASIAFNFENMNYLDFYEFEKPTDSEAGDCSGWKKLDVTKMSHPFMSNWWVPGCGLGYEHTFINLLADFLNNYQKKTQIAPTCKDALKTQMVCDAVLTSAQTKQWVAIDK